MSRITELDLWIGRRLQSLRQERSIAPGSFASRIGISVERLMQIESGTDRAEASEIAGAARAFDVPLVSFFPEMPGMSAEDDDFGNRFPDIETLLRILAKRGQLDEAYRTLWKLALS